VTDTTAQHRPASRAAPVDHGDGLQVPLDEVAPPTMEREGYVIESGGVSMKVLWVSEDGTAASGLWEARPGVIKGIFIFDENDYILSGRMTVTPEGGEPVEVRAGEVVHFPKGSVGTWEIHETDEELADWPETSEQFLDGAAAVGTVLHRSADGKRAHGIWTCTPGRVIGRFITDEVSVITQGRMTVVLEDGSRHEVQAGDVLTIDDGLQVEWIIHETLTKLWNVYHEDGLPF
jgi:uncharacterized cupin superfamily protein